MCIHCMDTILELCGKKIGTRLKKMTRLVFVICANHKSCVSMSFSINKLLYYVEYVNSNAGYDTA